MAKRKRRHLGDDDERDDDRGDHENHETRADQVEAAASERGKTVAATRAAAARFCAAPRREAETRLSLAAAADAAARRFVVETTVAEFEVSWRGGTWRSCERLNDRRSVRRLVARAPLVVVLNVQRSLVVMGVGRAGGRLRSMMLSGVAAETAIGEQNFRLVAARLAPRPFGREAVANAASLRRFLLY